MIIILKPFMTLIVIVHNLRVFGTGLNPFAPYCVAHHSQIMPQEQRGSMSRSLSRRRSFRNEVLNRDDRGWTSLHIGARKGDLKEVKRLLNEGMDVNAEAWGPKSKGLTALHLAAEGGHLDLMDELLERGANIDTRTKGACGWTPLHSAAKERRKEAVKFLVENGAFLPDDINDCRFNPPLHYCPGLEWAYEEVKRLQHYNGSSSETSCSSES
ncbi:phytochrome-interacting ankyrin-repeat protein 2-like isoform X2 [Cucurbita pepo subsp. pepo]|uniref:phytochrome-interacting ankyrin-repeat protein 2-like isoform X2 n=2 Tax=Cucurbita pepo subsp. pepo TaxID=3664 RepID=UPI000C9D9AEE|nr:phytochrome-interacting ankyrin-repeat protein 2-like isoform X2 [Cucurbita pepo subsp. pepo]